MKEVENSETGVWEVFEDDPITPASAEYLAIMERWKRDRLISETDWWATSDRTMTDAQTAYRTALRDVPSQAEFPNTVTWPTKPE